MTFSVKSEFAANSLAERLQSRRKSSIFRLPRGQRGWLGRSRNRREYLKIAGSIRIDHHNGAEAHPRLKLCSFIRAYD